MANHHPFKWQSLLSMWFPPLISEQLAELENLVSHQGFHVKTDLVSKDVKEVGKGHMVIIPGSVEVRINNGLM